MAALDRDVRIASRPPTVRARPPTDRRANAFDLLRLVAAFLVVVEHGWVLAGQGYPLIPPAGGTTIGGIGLGVFFLTSGYLILDSWLADPSPTRFLARRALRILPLYALVVVASGLVLGPLLTTLPRAAYLQDPGLWDYIGSNLLLFGQEFDLPGVFIDNPATAVNGSLWTIPVEILCYLGLMALGVAGVFRRRRLLMVLACLPVAVVVVVSTTGYTGTLIPRLISTEAAPLLAWFAIGMVVRLAWPGRKPPWVVVVVAAGLWALCWGTPAATPAALLTVTAATFAVAFGSPPVLHHPTGRTDLSYGIYALAYPVQQCIVASGVREGWLVTVLAAAAVTALAFLSWRWIEKPLLGLKPRTPPPGRHRMDVIAATTQPIPIQVPGHGCPAPSATSARRRVTNSSTSAT